MYTEVIQRGKHVNKETRGIFLSKDLPGDVAVVIDIFTGVGMSRGVSQTLKVGNALIGKRYNSIASRVPVSTQVQGVLASTICRENRGIN